MIRVASFVLCVFCASSSVAETLVATRTLRPPERILPNDLVSGDPSLAASEAAEVLIGGEVTETIYAGRPVTLAHTAAPALVARNEIVTLIYSGRAMQIVTEGRALGRAALGERVPVMNLASRAKLVGRVIGANTVEVSQ